MTDKYNVLRKLLRTIGLSEERVEELVAWIEEWLSGDNNGQSDGTPAPISYPYHLRDDFLSAAERDFFRVLQPAVSQWAVVFPKVRLGDLFVAKTSDNKEWYRARNRIERKHLDFLLCDPQTLDPLLGVELNDSSHKRQDRRERDRLVIGVFEAAGLPLVGIKWQRSYDPQELDRFLRSKAGLSATKIGTERAAQVAQPAVQVDQVQQATHASPACPECGAPMVLRTARQGKNAGNQFWGCTNYPRCKGIASLKT